MADRSSEFVLRFDGDAGTITSVLADVKSKFRAAVSELEATTKKVTLFGDIETRTQAASAALEKAKGSVASFAAALDQAKVSGAGATTDLEKGLQSAQAELKKAEREYLKNVDALTKLENSLTRAGVDTSNLARAQLKLSDATKIATAAANEQAAKQALGIKTLSDVQPQIQRLQAAYETLRNSGNLSAKENAIAQQALQARLRETYAEVSKVSGGVSSLSGGIDSLASGAAAKFLGVTAVIGTVTAAIRAGVAAAQELRNSLAEIGTVTTLSGEQLAALGDGVRQLATEVGFDLQQGLKATFELIRSGVPADNALEVLRISADAAKATLTDIGTASKASSLLLDSFGLEVGQLGGALDAIVKGSKQGGATLKEFADSAAPLLNVAREAAIPFDDLIATLTVMTDVSKDAQSSVGALTKIIVKLGDPEVRGKLRGLGVESTDLVGIFRELGQQGRSLQSIIDLGLASAKTAAGVSALTNNASKLPKALQDIREAAGEAERDVRKLYDTPRERAERFDAAIHESSVQIGELVGSGSKLADLSARVLNFFNGLSRATHGGAVEGTILDNVVSRWVASLFGVAPAAKAAAAGADEAAAAMKRQGEEAAAASAKTKQANADLAASAAALLAQIQALQAASTRDTGDIDARANAEIAALDRTTAAQAATARATIEIQTKAAAERLAIIQKTENAVLAAVNLAQAARVAKDRELSAETVKIRLDSLAPILKQYQDHYAGLISLQQQYVQKLNASEQERISFNQGIEKTLFDIRLGSLNSLDQYAAKVKEIDRLISEARRAGVEGDIAAAKKFTDQAIALSGTLKEVVDRDGVVVVRSYEAQAKSIEKIKGAAEAYNSALDQQDTLAKQGLDATRDGIAAVLPSLQELQKQYDALKSSVADGINFRVQLDEQAVNAALATINQLTADRTVKITPVVEQSGGGPIEAPAFARGGPVRRFAGGGLAFRSPGWSKVPGSGEGDTVPAALRVGSFVLRKAASRHYGDRLLGRMARGYAGGGSVEAAPRQNFWSEFRDTIERLRLLREASAGEQRARSGGTTLGTWAASLVENFVFFSDAHRKQVAKIVEESFDGWLAGIASAKSFHVPNVMDGSLLGLLKRYAGGGGVDTVPAMLTPGEWVINPRAVRRYGGGFMHAVNNLQVPRRILESALSLAPPPARFAMGGPVGSASAGVGGGSSVGSGARAGAGAYTFNIYAQKVDESEVRRSIIPIIDKIQRKGR